MRAAFQAAGIEAPLADARLLVAAAIGGSSAELLARPEEPLGRAAAERLTAYADRRLRREPPGRILGRREFWGLSFRLSPETLEPRPDTETIVATALALTRRAGESASLLDLGTGSGCLLVALLSELPGATGLGVDRSLDALRTARANADACGVGGRASFAASNWADAVSARFDLVVANPPYIPTADIARLEPEVALHDPLPALDGGCDGLSAIRHILGALPALLRGDGYAVIEIGHDQATAAGDLARAGGLAVDRLVRDLGGRDRALVLRVRS